MIKSEKVESTNPIKFDTKELENCLKDGGIYEKDNFKIKQVLLFEKLKQDENESNTTGEEDFMFALSKKGGEAPFLGMVNYHFLREGYGLNVHQNGDQYFGYYKDDKRHGHGIYSYKPIENNDYINSQYYYGIWEADKFNGKGVYLWLKEKKDIIPFTDYENAFIQAFVGESKNGHFIKGAFLKKEAKNILIYYGGIKNDKRDGDNCFYYSSNKEKICFGKYIEGSFVEGFVGDFGKNEKIKKLIEYKDEGNNNKYGQKLGVKKEKDLVKLLNKLRQTIYSNDYIKIIYEEIGNILKIRDEKMKDIDIVSNDKYEDIIKHFDINKITICQDIEKNFNN